jgi:chemotaxis protein histidine kinase CheA
VRLVKGQIKVKSEKHKGSTFEISIPLAWKKYY